MQSYKCCIAVLGVLIFISLPACNDADEVEKDKTVATLPKEITPAYEVTGTYKDTLPCASCPGIATTIIFSTDKKVQKTDLYLEKDEYSRSLSGTWEMETPQRIKVTYPDETEYYQLQSDEAISRIGESQQATDPASKYDYLLKKQSAISEPLALSGTYNQEMEDGYTQTLELVALNDQTFQVTISNTPQVATGCSFSGKGKFVNNRIEVNLTALESSLKGTMTITISGDTAILFTAEEAQRYDLMFFCGGGTSVAGSYVKQKEDISAAPGKVQ